MITFLFTTSNYPFSRLTRWGLDSDCSHFAIGFDLHRPSGIVFHSDFKGVRIDFLSHFKLNNTIRHRLEFKDELSYLKEEAFYQLLISKTYSKSYDWGAFAFYAMNIIGHKLFNFEISKRNLWESSDKYLCTELYEAIKEAPIGNLVSLPKVKKTNILLPHDLYEDLKRSDLFNEV